MELFRQAFADEDRGSRDPRRRHRRDMPDMVSALRQSRWALKSALFDFRDATAGEEALITEILERAAAEIRAVQAKRKV